NIEKTGEESYRVTMAVAGFAPDEISVVQEQNVLVVSARKESEDQKQLLHRGIATRAFQRRFELADFVKVQRAGLNDGLLTIELVREVPDATKPRRIEIAGAPSQPTAVDREPPKQLEQQAA